MSKIIETITGKFSSILGKFSKSSKLILNFKIKYLLPLGIRDRTFLETPLDSDWKIRIEEVIDCPDNRQIERVENAGQVKNGCQIMHNGIKVTLGGYYGAGIVQMLYQNKGVHEPQEEYAFQEVLKTISDGGTMLELGSYWSFYSVWFNKNVRNARNYLVEPEDMHLTYGINNFKLNQAKGTFIKSLIGRHTKRDDNGITLCVDDIIEENKIQFLDILHSDIQGYEFDMLLGARKAIDQNKIGYIFISTHGNDIHYKCLDFLKLNNFEILCHADENETYSYDGLIVAKSRYYKGLSKIVISKNKDSKVVKVF